jgi:hypothetical protein
VAFSPDGKLVASGSNGVVVRNIVAYINLGRSIHWRQPNHIDAEIVQIVEFRKNARNVAQSIAIAIFETSGPDLVTSISFHQLRCDSGLASNLPSSPRSLNVKTE